MSQNARMSLVNKLPELITLFAVYSLYPSLLLTIHRSRDESWATATAAYGMMVTFLKLGTQCGEAICGNCRISTELSSTALVFLVISYDVICFSCRYSVLLSSFFVLGICSVLVLHGCMLSTMGKSRLNKNQSHGVNVASSGVSTRNSRPSFLTADLLSMDRRHAIADDASHRIVSTSSGTSGSNGIGIRGHIDRRLVVFAFCTLLTAILYDATPASSVASSNSPAASAGSSSFSKFPMSYMALFLSMSAIATLLHYIFLHRLFLRSLRAVLCCTVYGSNSGGRREHTRLSGSSGGVSAGSRGRRGSGSSASRGGSSTKRSNNSGLGGGFNGETDFKGPIPGNFLAVCGATGSGANNTRYLDRARDMYGKYLQWRADNAVDDIMIMPQPGFEAILKHYPHAIHGYSIDGCAVVYEILGKSNAKGLAESLDNIDVLVWHFVLRNEYVFRCLLSDEKVRSVIDKYNNGSCELGEHVPTLPPAGRLMTVLDVAGISISSVTTDVISFIKKSSDIVDSYYPNRVKRLVIVNAPRWFFSVWSVIARVLPESVQKKIDILYDTKGLDKYIPKDQRPVAYGGTDVALGEWEGHKVFLQIGESWKTGVKFDVPGLCAPDSAAVSGSSSSLASTRAKNDAKGTNTAGSGSGKSVKGQQVPSPDTPSGGCDKRTSQSSAGVWISSGTETGVDTPTLKTPDTDDNGAGLLGWFRARMRQPKKVPVAYLGEKNLYDYNPVTSSWGISSALAESYSPRSDDTEAVRGTGGGRGGRGGGVNRGTSGAGVQGFGKGDFDDSFGDDLENDDDVYETEGRQGSAGLSGRGSGMVPKRGVREGYSGSSSSSMKGGVGGSSGSSRRKSRSAAREKKMTADQLEEHGLVLAIQAAHMASTYGKRELDTYGQTQNHQFNAHLHHHQQQHQNELNMRGGGARTLHGAKISRMFTPERTLPAALDISQLHDGHHSSSSQQGAFMGLRRSHSSTDAEERGTEKSGGNGVIGRMSPSNRSVSGGGAGVVYSSSGVGGLFWGAGRGAGASSLPQGGTASGGGIVDDASSHSEISSVDTQALTELDSMSVIDSISQHPKISAQIFLLVVTLYMLSSFMLSFFLTLLPVWMASGSRAGGLSYSVYDIALILSASAMLTAAGYGYCQTRVESMMKASPLRAMRIGCGVIVVAAYLLITVMSMSRLPPFGGGITMAGVAAGDIALPHSSVSSSSSAPSFRVNSYSKHARGDATPRLSARRQLREDGVFSGPMVSLSTPSMVPDPYLPSEAGPSLEEDTVRDISAIPALPTVSHVPSGLLDSVLDTVGLKSSSSSSSSSHNTSSAGSAVASADKPILLSLATSSLDTEILPYSSMAQHSDLTSSKENERSVRGEEVDNEGLSVIRSLYLHLKRSWIASIASAVASPVLGRLVTQATAATTAALQHSRSLYAEPMRLSTAPLDAAKLPQQEAQPTHPHQQPQQHPHLRQEKARTRPSVVLERDPSIVAEQHSPPAPYQGASGAHQLHLHQRGEVVHPAVIAASAADVRKPPSQSMLAILLPALLIAALVSAAYVVRKAASMLLHLTLSATFGSPAVVRTAINSFTDIVGPALAAVVFSNIISLNLAYPMDASFFLCLSICVMLLVYMGSVLLRVQFRGDYGVMTDHENIKQLIADYSDYDFVVDAPDGRSGAYTYGRGSGADGSSVTGTPRIGTGSSGSGGFGGYGSSAGAGGYGNGSHRSGYGYGGAAAAGSLEAGSGAGQHFNIRDDLLQVPLADLSLLFSKLSAGYGSKLYNLKDDFKDL